MQLTEVKAEAADIQTMSTVRRCLGLSRLTFEQCRMVP